MRWDNLLCIYIYFFVVCLLNIFTCNFIVLKQFGPHLEELFVVWSI